MIMCTICQSLWTINRVVTIYIDFMISRKAILVPPLSEYFSLKRLLKYHIVCSALFLKYQFVSDIIDIILSNLVPIPVSVHLL